MMAPPTTGLAEALARLARNRDPDAWAVILDVAGEDCWRCCLAVCGQASLAEDAFQDALLQIRDHADQFRIQGADADGDARRWVKRVATTMALQTCRARGRARHRDRRAGAERAMEDHGDPASRLHAADDLAALRESLATLDEPRRTAITLHHLQGMPLAEVAAELGRPVGTVKTWIHRGMEELHTLLASRGVSVSATSLVALFAAGQASAATAVVPTTTVAATALLTAPATAGVNVIALTTAGALSMAIKAGLIVALTASAVTLPFILGQEWPVDAPPAPAVKPAAQQAPRSMPVVQAAVVQDAPPVPATGAEEVWRVELRKRLQQRLTLNVADQELTEVVDLMRTLTGISIVVAPDVVAAGGARVTLRVKDMPAQDAFTWICTLTRTHWAMHSQAVYISATPLQAAPSLRLYDVADLLAPGVPGGKRAEEMVAIIRQEVAPASWKGDATITADRTVLVVNQSPEVHRLVEERLVRMRQGQVVEPWRAAILNQLEKTVTLNFEGKDLVDIVDFLQRLTGTNIIIDPAVIAASPPLINLKVADMPLKYVLEYIVRQTSTRYVLRDQAVYITR
jgi:RNA polymerase sigma-70 factor (ECF subfamily)